MQKIEIYVKTGTIIIEDNIVITPSKEKIIIKRHEKLLTL